MAAGGESLWSIVFKFVNFGILVAALIYFVGKPLKKFLANRHKTIKDKIEETQKALNEAQELRTRYQDRLAKLDEFIGVEDQHQAVRAGLHMGDPGLSHEADFAEDIPGLKAGNDLPPEENIRLPLHEHVHPEIQIPLLNDAPVHRHFFPCRNFHEIGDLVLFKDIEERDLIQEVNQDGFMHLGLNHQNPRSMQLAMKGREWRAPCWNNSWSCFPTSG